MINAKIGLGVVQLDEDTEKRIKINWLLVGLMAVSVAIHAGVFLQMSGMVDFKPSSYIPISIRKDVKPPVRAIPKPPARQPLPAARKPRPGIAPDQTVPSIAPVPEESKYIQPVEMPSMESLAPARDTEPPAAQETLPETVPAPLPDADAGDTALSQSQPVDDGGDAARMNYFNAVRLKIESHKKYPETARQQQMEGVIVAAFVIHPDGSISDLSVASGSGHESLDTAALEAVTNAAPFSPLPAKYFNKPATVKVPIAFQIIR